MRKVQELNRENFAVRQHLKYVELYPNPESYNALTYEDTLLMGQELAPLITAGRGRCQGAAVRCADVRH